MLGSLLLRLVRRLAPDTPLQVKVSLLGSQDLAHPRSRQKLEPNGIGSPLVGMCIKNVTEALELVILQPSVALFLLVTFDPLYGIACPPMPLDRQVEHLGEEGQNPVSLIGAVLQT